MPNASQIIGTGPSLLLCAGETQALNASRTEISGTYHRWAALCKTLNLSWAKP